MFAASKTASVSAAGPEDKFNYVTMLLHGDGTNGAQNNTFLDSSTNNFTITRNGNTTQGSFSPYGSNWSNLFNGTNDFLVSRNATKQDSDFTFECWLYTNPSAYSGDQMLIGNAATNYAKLGINTSGQLFIDVSNVGVLVTSSTSLNNNNWNHIAMVRSGTSAFIYLNGVRVASATKSTWVAGTASPGTYLAAGDSGGGSYEGYISNIRFVYGTALYTNSTYTVPTSSLTAISGTSLLTCQSNRFIDSSSNAYALTVSGSPSVQRFNPFGTSTAYSTSVIGGSGYFDKSGDYLDGPTNSAFAFGTGDFTLSAWVYIFNGTSAQIIWTNQTTSSASAPNIGFFILNNKVCINNTNTAHSESTGTIANNSWNYVGVTKSSGTYTFYINGSASGTTSSIGNNDFTENACRIGYGNYGSGFYFGGYITDLRVIKGSAVTPSLPTAPVGTVTNTQLLLNMTNGAIFDNAMINNLETVGNAQISTSVKKYGTGSLAFDGTGDWLAVPTSQNFAPGVGDWTIECWLYPISGNWAIVAGSNFYINNNSGTVYVGDASVDIIAVSPPSTGVWTHIAVTKSGSTVRLFYDGTQVGSSTTALSTAITTSMVVGGRPSSSISTNGYIDDLRITKGYARYTTTFTPPTSALSDTGPY